LNRALAKFIVDCLRMIGSPQEPLAEIQQFSRRDWDRTAFWLNGSGLAHYFLRRVRELQSEGAVPSEVLARLARNLTVNQCRLEVMAGEFNDLNHRLSDASLSYAAVKGFDLAPDYAPTSRCELGTPMNTCFLSSVSGERTKFSIKQDTACAP